jgi:hypothetical protein
MSVSRTRSASAFDRERFSIRANGRPLLSRRFHFYDPAGTRFALIKIADYRVISRVDVLDGDGRDAILHLRERAGRWPVTYDLFDADSSERIGGMQQRPWKSLFLEEWIILDGADREGGRLRQSSLLSAFLHHFLLFVPITYSIDLEGIRAATCRQNANPLMPMLAFDFGGDPGRRVDRRIAAAVAVLLLESSKHDE